MADLSFFVILERDSNAFGSGSGVSGVAAAPADRPAAARTLPPDAREAESDEETPMAGAPLARRTAPPAPAPLTGVLATRPGGGGGIRCLADGADMADEDEDGAAWRPSEES